MVSQQKFFQYVTINLFHAESILKSLNFFDLLKNQSVLKQNSQIKYFL